MAQVRTASGIVPYDMVQSFRIARPHRNCFGVWLRMVPPACCALLKPFMQYEPATVFACGPIPDKVPKTKWPYGKVAAFAEAPNTSVNLPIYKIPKLCIWKQALGLFDRRCWIFRSHGAQAVDISDACSGVITVALPVMGKQRFVSQPLVCPYLYVSQAYCRLESNGVFSPIRGVCRHHRVVQAPQKFPVPVGGGN